MPSNNDEIYRWLGESICMLVIPHSSFISNQNNFPILSKKQQEGNSID